MSKPKMHRASGSGNPMCGRDSIETTQLTENNDEVTCGSCWRSMWGSWGVEPPVWVSRNKGGRKLKEAKKEESEDGEAMRCSFCGKSRDDVSWLVAGPAINLLDELPRVYICDECVPVCADVVRTGKAEKELLAAKTEREVDKAFDHLFDVVNQARKTGSTKRLEETFRWVQTPEVLEHLHIDLLIACLRLTFTMKQYLETWPDLLLAIEKELTRRGDDSERLLWGLMR